MRALDHRVHRVVVDERQRKRSRERGRFDSGLRPHGVEQLLIERASTCVVVAARLEVERDRRDVARVEAGVGSPRRLEAADHQAGADEQQQRDGDL